MTDLDARAEHAKLVRLLDTSDDDLAFLLELPADALRPVRERISDLLFAQGEGMFDRLVAASRLLPNAVTAAIAQRVFPPLVCAQVAGKLDPSRARELIRHVDVTFLAAMAAETDPRTIAHLVPELPREVMVAAATEMNSRGDHLASGRLVGLAPDDVIPDLLDAIDDDADLLEIAFYLEDRERLDDIVVHVPDARLRHVLEVARDTDQWPAALVLTGHLSPGQTRRVAAVAAEADEETLTALLESVQCEGLWTALLPLIAHMADADLGRVADLPVLRRREVVAAAVDAATEVEDGRDVLVRVVAAMGGEARQDVMRWVEELDPALAAEVRTRTKSPWRECPYNSRRFWSTGSRTAPIWSDTWTS